MTTDSAIAEEVNEALNPMPTECDTRAAGQHLWATDRNGMQRAEQESVNAG
jgi:hypothetical protein